MEKDAEKAIRVFSKKDSDGAKKGEKHFQSMRLPSLNIPLRKPAPTKFRLKQMKKISTALFYHAKPVSSGYKSFYQAAFEAYRCCQEQGLHLFNLKKIYEEKSHPVKNVKSWRLQETTIARSRIQQIKDQPQEAKSKHEIKKISEKSSPGPRSS